MWKDSLKLSWFSTETNWVSLDLYNRRMAENTDRQTDWLSQHLYDPILKELDEIIICSDNKVAYERFMIKKINT